MIMKEPEKKPWAYNPQKNRIHIRDLIKAQGFLIRFLHSYSTLIDPL